MFEAYDDILLVEDVCEILKISSTQTYRLLRSGRLNGYKEGKDWKIPKIALESYIRKRMSERCS